MTTEKLLKISRNRIREEELHRNMVQAYVDVNLPENTEKRHPRAISTCIYGGAIMALSTNLAYADNEDYEDSISNVMQPLIDVLIYIFEQVGKLICIYAIYLLIIALRNEDPESKFRAGSLLGVCAFIGFGGLRFILNKVGLLS